MHSSFCQVVVLVNASLQKQLEIDDWTHRNGVHFIAAGTHGLFGYVNAMFVLIVTHALYKLCVQ
jgi:hypothetical protein